MTDRYSLTYVQVSPGYHPSLSGTHIPISLAVLEKDRALRKFSDQLAPLVSFIILFRLSLV